jgi:hypothetical protein
LICASAMSDTDTFMVFNLADHHGWTIRQVLDMTLAEYQLWWAYHDKNGDLKKKE